MKANNLELSPEIKISPPNEKSMIKQEKKEVIIPELIKYIPLPEEMIRYNSTKKILDLSNEKVTNNPKKLKNNEKNLENNNDNNSIIRAEKKKNGFRKKYR